MRRFTPFVLIASCLLLASPAQADDPPPPQQTAAQALFNEGRKLMDQGRFAEACPKFAASNKLDPGAGTLLNLARCYDKAGKSASAWTTYLSAASAARTSRPDWERAARDRAAELEPTLAKLTIVVPIPSRIPGLKVVSDGRPIDQAAWDVPIPVDPGEVVVEASAPNKQSILKKVTVAKGATVTLAVPLLPPQQGAPAPTSEATKEKHRKDIGLLVVAGVGLSAVGTYMGLKARSTYASALERCTPDRRCDAEGVALGDKAYSFARASSGTFLLSGIAFAGAIALYVASRPERPGVSSIGVSPQSGGAAFVTEGVW